MRGRRRQASAIARWAFVIGPPCSRRNLNRKPSASHPSPQGDAGAGPATEPDGPMTAPPAPAALLLGRGR
jgi:hypothetical protein